MLEKYRHDTRIRHITGCNLQQGKKWGSDSYYFSNLTHVWGWASWRRVWKDYDKTLDKYNNDDVCEKLRNIFDDPLVVTALKHIFDSVKSGELDTWDYQLDFANYFNHGLTIIPNENLISNIGFGNNATHTSDQNSINANVPLGNIDQVTHPLYILPEKGADFFTFDSQLEITEKKRKQNLFRRRVKRWFKATLKNPVK